MSLHLRFQFTTVYWKYVFVEKMIPKKITFESVNFLLEFLNGTLGEFGTGFSLSIESGMGVDVGKKRLAFLFASRETWDSLKSKWSTRSDWVPRKTDSDPFDRHFDFNKRICIYRIHTENKQPINKYIIIINLESQSQSIKLLHNILRYCGFLTLVFMQVLEVSNC